MMTYTRFYDNLPLDELTLGELREMEVKLTEFFDWAESLPARLTKQRLHGVFNMLEEVREAIRQEERRLVPKCRKSIKRG
jgi:hypothetical protein